MGRLMKATLMALAAGCVLLLAGAFPLAGAPGVYRGGLMVSLGLVVIVLCLWGAWRLARGQVWRLLGGMLCLFLAVAGCVGVWRFGTMACFLGARGTESVAAVAVWFGRVGMICHALVAAMFVGIFGYLALRLMRQRLWLAALHGWVALLLVGANVDFKQEVSYRLSAPSVADGSAEVSVGSGEERIGIAVLSFDVQRYDDATPCTLLQHVDGEWRALGTPQREGDVYVLGNERWAVDSLQRAPGLAGRFLLLPGKPTRMLMEGAAPVKDYRATCRMTTRGGQVREEVLRVNHPISCEGYLVYLMSYTMPTQEGMPPRVDIELRRAPGRLPALLSMLGIIICAFGWAFCPREEVAA